MTEKIHRIDAVSSATGLSKSGIYKLIAEGKFPRPLKLLESGRAVGWLDSEIRAWQDTLIKYRAAEREVA